MFKQNISFEIWGGENGKYRLRDNDGNPVDQTPEDTCDRVAKALADVEIPEKREYWYKEFKSVLGTKFAGGGRIMANVGAKEYKKETSSINCVVSRQIPDSLAGIMDIAKDAALILKAGCGIGYDFSTIRPKGSHVFGAGAGTSGVISFMKIFDAVCSTILSGGARRGAQMACLDVQSPEIEDFITAKRQDGVLRYFNCSVLVTDRFMKAVENDEDWDLWFWEKDRSGRRNAIPSKEICLIKKNDIPYNYPEFKYFKFAEDHCEVEYENCDVNTIFKKKIFKTVKARYLYDLIMISTYNFWEPGFLLIDRANIENNLYFCEIFRATNPCFSGDTLIAVADGRKYVSIKQLAEEEKDIPVYSISKNGEISIQMGRRPRLTGYGEELCQIEFDDGGTIKTTYNHEFILSNFEKVKAKDLKIGDLLLGCDDPSNLIENLYLNDANENINHGLKNCENCGSLFLVSTFTREVSFCSVSCFESKNIHSLNFDNSGVSLKRINGRKIKSLDMVSGYSNVFNITVDENHTIAAVTPINQKDGSVSYMWVFSLQCGEQPLFSLSSCLLGSIILPSYIKQSCRWLGTAPLSGAMEDFDFERLRKDIQSISRLMDNVVELNNLPLKELQNQILMKRRHGLGFTGLGSTLNMIGLSYGSNDSVLFAETIALIIAQESLLANIELAKEKGPAPIFESKENREAILKSVYLERLINSFDENILYIEKNTISSEQIKNDILQYGLRYSHATSIAPTGTLSLTWGNNCSGGIEPEPADWYYRNVRVPGKKTKVQEEVMSYSYFAWKEKNGDQPLPDYWRTTKDLSVHDHLRMQSVVQKWVDSSISKTINIPADYSFEDFKNVYMDGWKMGLKGITTYRPNASIGAGVLTQKKDLDSALYTFTLESGEEISLPGSDFVEYDGETHNVANLFDALKEGIYGNM